MKPFDTLHYGLVFLFTLIYVVCAANISEMVCSGKVLGQYHGSNYGVSSMTSSNYIERTFAYIVGALPNDPVIDTPVNWVCPQYAGSPSCCDQTALDIISSATFHIRDVIRDFSNKRYLKAFDQEGAVWLKQQEACTFNSTLSQIQADLGGQDNVYKSCTWWKNFVLEMETVYNKIEDEVVELFDSLVEFTRGSLCMFCDPSVNNMFAAEYDENNNLLFEIHVQANSSLTRMTEAFINFKGALESTIWNAISYYFPMDSDQQACAADNPGWECNTGGNNMMVNLQLPDLELLNYMLTEQILNSNELTNIAETINGLSIAPLLDVLDNVQIGNHAYRLIVDDAATDQTERIDRVGSVTYLLDQKIEAAIDLTNEFTWSVRPPEPDFEEDEPEYTNWFSLSNFTWGIITGILIGLIIWGFLTAVIYYWLNEMAEHGLDFVSRRKQRQTAEAIEEQEAELQRQKKKMKVAEDRRSKDLAIERAEIKREREKQKLVEKKKKLRMQERRRAGPPVEALKKTIGRDSDGQTGQRGSANVRGRRVRSRGRSR